MIKLDKEACIGCAVCASMCPDVFEIQDDGKAGLISQENIDCAKEAAEACPVSCITVD